MLVTLADAPLYLLAVGGAQVGVQPGLAGNALQELFLTVLA
jgi:hypothetical protein